MAAWKDYSRNLAGEWFCARCGFVSPDDNVYDHHSPEGCLAAALRRAAAAEAERDMLQATLWHIADLLGLPRDDPMLLSTTMHAVSLLAEVEPQTWRPITDDAPAPLERVVIDDPVDGLDVGWRLPEQPHIFLTRRGRSYLADDFRGWFSIPPTAEATEEGG